jgi:hypothetical protein
MTTSAPLRTAFIKMIPVSVGVSATSVAPPADAAYAGNPYSVAAPGTASTVLAVDALTMRKTA